MKREKTGSFILLDITGKTGMGCLVAACCFMLFCGCGAKAPALILEGGGASCGELEVSGYSGDGEPEMSKESGNTGPGISKAGDAGMFGDEGSQEALQNSGAAGGAQEELVYVQVSGAVVKPGVYQLPADSRVFMAVELAGGLTPEADEGSLNQAQAVSDGQQIYVYAVGEQARQEEARESDGRVNLNTATAQELMALPGIGQAKADSIISYRESSGGFQAIEDLMKIEGIKEGVFSKIKDRIKI